jgi:hypothetical protein
VPLVVPDEEVPVVPAVPELLEVPDESVEEGVLDVEPEDDPMPEDDSEDDEPLEPG